MDLYLAGAEQPIYMRQLAELGATHIAISFFEWQRRHSSDDIYKHVPNGIEVCITPGIAKKTDIDFRSFVDDYVEFAERNAEQCLVYGLDAPGCPVALQQEARKRLDTLPNVVVFPFEDEPYELLANRYERLGVNARLGKSIPTNELRRISASLYGSNITDAKVLKGARFEASTSFAWLSARRYGELRIWSRGRIHHYAAENLARAVRAHSEAIEALGVDPRAVAANDSGALVALAVKSLQAMAENLSRRPRDRQEPETAAGMVSRGTSEPVHSGAGEGAVTALEPVIERERIPLPTLGTKSQEEGPELIAQGSTVRSCDNCNLAGACPEFRDHSACAYGFSVEIRTRDQWEAASHFLLETQMQRIAFAHFAEQVEGQILTPRLGQEMDRFYKLLTAHKDLEQKPDPTPGGAMSKFFPAAPPLEQRSSNDGEEGDIEEAEVVSEEEGEQADIGAAY